MIKIRFFSFIIWRNFSFLMDFSQKLRSTILLQLLERITYHSDLKFIIFNLGSVSRLGAVKLPSSGTILFTQSSRQQRRRSSLVVKGLLWDVYNVRKHLRQVWKKNPSRMIKKSEFEDTYYVCFHRSRTIVFISKCSLLEVQFFIILQAAAFGTFQY